MFCYKQQNEPKRRFKYMQLKPADLNKIALGLLQTIKNYCEIEPALEEEYKAT